MSNEELNDLLAKLAASGKQVNILTGDHASAPYYEAGAGPTAYSDVTEGDKVKENTVIPGVGNYKPQIKEQHIYTGVQRVDAEPVAEDVEYVEVMPDVQRELKSEEQPDNPIPKCFRNASEFVRQQVKAIVNDFYLGSAANLALIEIVCFDHGLLLKRNNHKAFIETLVAWGAMTCDDVNKTANNMAYKMMKVPKSGYQEWVGDGYVNDKKTCIDIGKKLEPTMRYSR